MATTILRHKIVHYRLERAVNHVEITEYSPQLSKSSTKHYA